MKVISGIYGSRTILSKQGLSTRPTMDKVKQAMFNIIGSKINDSIVLDLFSGSGQLGIECISRGAKFVYFNDHDYEAFKIIQTNINNLKIDKSLYKLTKLDYKKALSLIDKQIDILFLDPPYKDYSYYLNSINYLKEHNLLSQNALIICEAENELDPLEIDGFILKEYKYGNKKLLVYC